MFASIIPVSGLAREKAEQNRQMRDNLITACQISLSAAILEITTQNKHHDTAASTYPCPVAIYFSTKQAEMGNKLKELFLNSMACFTAPF